MIEVLKTKCQINQRVEIHFNHETYVGQLLEASDHYIELRTRNGSVILSAERLKGALEFHLLDSEEVEKERDNGRYQIPIKSFEGEASMSGQQLDETASSTEYTELEGKLDRAISTFPVEGFTLSVQKYNRLDDDNSEKELIKQLNKEQSRYDYAETLQVAKNREDKYKEIERRIRSLLANHYFDSNLRYNLAVILCKLNDITGAIQELTLVPALEKRENCLLFLSYLHFIKQNESKCLEYFHQYALLSDLSEEHFFFLLGLINKQKAYFLLPELIRERSPFEDQLLEITKLWLSREGQPFASSGPAELQVVSDLIQASAEKLKSLGASRKQIFGENTNSASDKIVSHNAQIKKFWPASRTGHLLFRRANGVELFASFESKSLVDSELIEDLKLFADKENEGSIPVFCYLKEKIDNRNKLNKVAYGIHFPKTLSSTLNFAQALLQSGANEDARGILLELKNQFVHEPDIIKALSQIPEIPQTSITTSKNRNIKKSSNYSKANVARQRRDWRNAKRYLLLAIAANDKKESAIKDLATIYNQEKEYDKAIDLLEKHIDDMPNPLAVFNLLATFNSHSKRYERAIDYLQKVRKLTPAHKHISTDRRIAYCFYQLKDYDKAKLPLVRILKKEPNDEIAKRWISALEQAEASGSYEYSDSVFNDVDFSVHNTYELPVIIKNELDKREYAGIKEINIAKENFTPEILNSLRREMRNQLKGRHQDRAAYLLTEANLMEILEKDNPNYDQERNSVLAKYCNSMALSSAKEKASDVVRFYYIEAFKLENEWRAVMRQVANYLYSFNIKGENLILKHNDSENKDRDIALVNAIRYVLVNHNSSKVWNGLLEIFIYSVPITQNLLKAIFDNEEARRNAIDYLASLDISINDEDDQSEFSNCWEAARKMRRMQIDSWFDAVKAFNRSSSLDSAIDFLHKSLDGLTPEWFNRLDKDRLESIGKEVVLEGGFDYLRQTDYIEKDRLHGLVSTCIDRILLEIEQSPTRISSEGLSPLLQHLKDLLDLHFDNIKKASTPTVSLNVLGEFVVVNGYIDLQVSIKNEDKNKAPIDNIELAMVDNTDFAFIENTSIDSTALKGGEETFGEIKVKVSERVVQEKIGYVKLLCKYKSRANPDSIIEIEEEKDVSLYDNSEFQFIQNAFSGTANSNAVTDPNMFFGRDQFIDQIVDVFKESRSKSYVIYGQKRSGKSSVLYHLKEKLKRTENNFCIDFSMGGIIDEFDVFSFYYKILREIEKELQAIKSTDQNAPLLEMPDVNLFERRPSIVFYDTMHGLLKSFAMREHWKKKRIVVLIDEFTYLYAAIRRGDVSSSFMKTWKDVIDQGFFNTVLVAQDVMPDFRAKFPNELGVTHEERLSYLKKEDARNLIETPIWNKAKGESRFLGNAVEKIIDYTAGNPYYIQIFCQKLVDHLNEKRTVRATIVTVNEVARKLTIGKEALSAEHFDNLITAGDADLEANPFDHTFEVLKQIAGASRPFGSCKPQLLRDRVVDTEIANRLDDILRDLERRQVISVESGSYRIEVQLFQEWLINRQ